MRARLDSLIACLFVALLCLAQPARAELVSYQQYLGLSFQPGSNSGALAPGDTAPTSDGYLFSFEGDLLTVFTQFDRPSRGSLPFGYAFRLSDDLAFDFAGSPFSPICIENSLAGPCARPGEGVFLSFLNLPLQVAEPVSIAVTRIGQVDEPATLLCLAAALPLAAWFGRRRRS